MEEAKSFKSLLEALLEESHSNPEPRTFVFTEDLPLGNWVEEIRVATPPQRTQEAYQYYSPYALRSEGKKPRKKKLNAPPNKPKIPASFDWKNESSTAKMIFNTYGTVKITEQSSLSELKKAYKKLLFLFHPDQNNGDRDAHERFLQLQKAFRILKKQVSQ